MQRNIYVVKNVKAGAKNIVKYRIKSILHTGTYGEKNTLRTDGKYPSRTGRVVEFDERDIVDGFPLYMYYITDDNGNEYEGINVRRYALRTSSVIDWDYVYDDVIRIETINSIYELEKIKELHKD